MSNFVAIDFETADYGRDSACSVGIVKVAHGKVVTRRHHLIRPPRREFVFTYVHGIDWVQVAKEPTFGELWPKIEGLFGDADFLAAHSASFDSGVLDACCRASGVAPPGKKFVCTVALARKVWDVRPTKLPDVCRRLKIKLNHHDALSDADACARIVLHAMKAGAKL
jgi:DNA polymerase-3 subunit epsilon